MHRHSALFRRLSPEVRLLLLAAGAPSMDGEIETLLRSSRVNWADLLVLADTERATAVLWRRLRAHSLPALSDEQRARFEQVAMIADFSAGYLEQRIGETTRLLGGLGIRPLLLKGAALASSVYPSFVERPMGDIDLVVQRDRAEEAFAAFQTMGWRWDATEFPRERYRGHHHFPPLVDARGMDVRLELHTELFVEGSPFQLSSAQLFASGRDVMVGGGIAVIPSPEHLLLHTCIHFTWSHMMLFGAWRAFRDVSALSDSGLDWDRFLGEAKRNRAETSCFWTLRLAEGLAGAAIPAQVMGALRRHTSERLIGVCERHVAREMFPSPDGCPSQWLRRRLWEVAIRPKESGHGDARPWLLDDMAPENVNPDQREVGMLRAARQLPRLGAWVRYLRVLAG